jgi:tRNA modification GTPase
VKTIVALATGQINCAIHIVRLSGDNCYDIVNRCLKTPIKHTGYKLIKNAVIDNKKIIDNVLVLTFVKPYSFTGEDCVEIHCHGGLFLANTIIKILIKHGATLATRGEFSKRAYLNNKISLNNAESINNLIAAKSKLALDVAAHGMDNVIVKRLTTFAENLFTLIGQVEVNIDYPEYDDQPQIKAVNFTKQLKLLINKLSIIINNSKIVQKVMKGFNVAIVGAPNVGKSSLLNAILKQERAIVSPIPGTTRDAISESLIIDGVAINLIDTAGFRTTTDNLEAKGVGKTKENIANADLIIHLQDATKTEKR